MAPGPNAFPYRLGEAVFEPHKRQEPACSAIVLRKYKVAYVPIPKNACTSIKIFIYEWQNKKKFAEPFNNIHQRFSHLAVDFDRFVADREHFKFLVVRDPLERFVSAYNNRVLHYGELSEAWLLKHSRREIKLLKTQGLTFNPDINEFTRNLMGYVKISLKVRHHVIPQSMFFHGKPQAFDKIYNIRDLAILESDLSEKLRAEIKFPKVQETAGLKNGARLEDLDTENLRFLRNYYAADYEALKNYL